MSTPNKVPCPACGGSALSPYPDDGGSCPHCFNGEVEAVEQRVQPTGGNVCYFCGLPCGDKPYHLLCDPATSG